MKLNLTSIDLDSSIQCRAAIDMGLVNDYAEAMTQAAIFPPVILYGTEDRCWIADGWHRVMASLQIAAIDIDANLHKGGRIDALRAALSANATHGLKRTNADKRRCVEIALREWPKLSDVKIGELCGVNDKTVATYRPATLGSSEPEKRTGKDGKSYPAHRAKQPRPDPCPTPLPLSPSRPTPILGPPREGLRFARSAIMDLEQIRSDDIERAEAFATVKDWIDEHE